MTLIVAKTKTLLAVCLACLALAACLCAAAPGRALAADWAVGCSTGAGTLYVGDTLTVDVTATGDGIASLSGKLSYDKDVLELASITQGSALSGTYLGFISSTSTGKLGFYGNEADTSAGVVIATATFTCKSATNDAKVELTEASGRSSGAGSEVEAESTSVVDVTVCPGSYLAVYKCTIALDGVFGMQVALAIPDEVMAFEGAQIEVANGDGFVVCTVPLTSGVAAGYSYNNAPVYNLTCPVPPAWVCDNLTIRARAQSGALLKLRSSSGADCTSAGISGSVASRYGVTTSGGSTETQLLAAAHLYYASKCQAYFNHNTSQSAISQLEVVPKTLIASAANNVTADSLSAQKPTWTWSAAVDFAGCNLSFGGATGLYATFEIDEGEISDYRYYVDDVEVSAEAANPTWSGADSSKTYVTLSKTGVRVNDLDVTHTFKVVKVSDGSVAASCTLSARGYAWMCLSNNSASDTLKALCQYLCACNKYADAYLADDLGEGVDDQLDTDSKSGDLMPAYRAHTVGDVNDNGKINIVDAQIVFDMSNGVWTTDGSTTAYDKLVNALSNGWDAATLTRTADVNSDNIIDATDARAIQVTALNRASIESAEVMGIRVAQAPGRT